MVPWLLSVLRTLSAAWRKWSRAAGPYDLVVEVAQTGKLPVTLFTAGLGEAMVGINVEDIA
jgi:pyridoxal biosynthesis lyase PdxS